MPKQTMSDDDLRVAIRDIIDHEGVTTPTAILHRLRANGQGAGTERIYAIARRETGVTPRPPTRSYRRRESIIGERTRDAIRTALIDHGPTTPAKIAKVTRRGESAVKQMMRKMLAEGSISRLRLGVYAINPSRDERGELTPEFAPSNGHTNGNGDPPSTKAIRQRVTNDDAVAGSLALIYGSVKGVDWHHVVQVVRVLSGAR